MSNSMDSLNAMNKLWDFRLELEHCMKGQALLEEFFYRHSDSYHITCKSDRDDERDFMRRVQEHFGFDDSE